VRYEDRCWECQPQLEDKGRLYCEEHGLYEDECFLCHPELKSDADEKKNSMLQRPGEASPALFCKEHRVPEAECGICQPQRTAQLEPGGELKVRFESPHAAAKAGVQTVPARESTAQASISAFCEVSYNENALARITPLAPGIVRKVLVDVGNDVKAGDVLVEVHSSEVASAKAAFVAAVVDLDLKEVACEREQRLAKKKIASDKEVQEADAACKTAELTLSTARQRLLNYGFTLEEVEAIEKDRDTSAVLFVRAPYDGTLVERRAVVGEAVQPGESVFSLADLRSVWLSLSIPADRAGLTREGLRVEATFSRLSGEVAGGEITWVNTSIDEKSRMLRARAVVGNDDRKLRAGMFGDARVFVADARAAVDVPKGAIQRFENNLYVFVKIEDDLYALRRVATAASPSKDMVAVVEGLRANEPIVATGAFTVMSEFLKSRLGAGCVDDK
jgi:cobalt-zinc-cadmium efflux system membrane fusion protein